MSRSKHPGLTSRTLRTRGSITVGNSTSVTRRGYGKLDKCLGRICRYYWINIERCMVSRKRVQPLHRESLLRPRIPGPFYAWMRKIERTPGHNRRGERTAQPPPGSKIQTCQVFICSKKLRKRHRNLHESTVPRPLERHPASPPDLQEPR